MHCKWRVWLGTWLMLLGTGEVFAQIDYQVQSLTSKPLHKPWTLLQLPDRRWVVTERKGNLVVIDENGQLSRSKVALPGLYFKGQGGLLDIALAHDFALSNRVLITYATGNDAANQLVVATAVLDDDSLSQITPIVTVQPAKATPVHFAGRLAKLADGTWLVSSGDGFDYREQAQDKSSQLGKILRFREDGSAPKDNPFAEAPLVYSLGHRNPQGLVVDPQTKQIISHEHGPAGGDEVNIIEAGTNYGWPVITNGKDYSGARISPFEEYPGMAQPRLDWTPSVAPSGMALYRHSKFADLTGQLLVTTLKAQALLRVNMSAQPPRSERIFATIDQRLRDVAVGKDGAIYVLTDGAKAEILKVTPAGPASASE
ncbi:PQQ-dependent sugar dehydrogenase [Salinimonas marina]|uniref:PQQ-dependent sugar dehydrogenase n=1 Tax=Salinimonas marina TaxID=2785918 RepID=A0A7S9DWW6_9ALTE|nr:PQQ-dependent sugar dehydrogenase [Salinimonas marina]QPG05208.1 PQQ-dependent sugar dehydrogenase [Salinimonas marina]